MKTKTTVIYNENDGHSYIWSDAECDWIGFPTFADGQPDWLNPTPIEDMEFADEQTEKNLRSFLMEFEEDEGVSNFDPNDPIYWKEEK